MRSRVTRGDFFLLACLLLATVWAGTAPGAEEEKEWSRLFDFSADDFISHTVTAIDVDTAGRVWVGTDRGLTWTEDSGRTWNAVNLGYATPIQPWSRGGETSSSEPALAGAALQRRNSITCIKAGRTGVWVGTLNGLCFSGYEEQDWHAVMPSDDAPGPEIWSVEEYLGKSWAAASNGVFRSDNYGIGWREIKGRFPRPVRSITIGDWEGKQTVWLAGFDSPPSYGGGIDVLRSQDGGETWDSLETNTASPIARIVSSRAHRIVSRGSKLWAATRNGLAFSRNGRRGLAARGAAERS